MSYTVPCSACQEGIDHDGNHCRLYPVHYRDNIENSDPTAYPTCWLCPDCWNKLTEKVSKRPICDSLAHPSAECEYCASFQTEQFRVEYDAHGVSTPVDRRDVRYETGYEKIVFCEDCWMSIQTSLIPIRTLMGQDHVSIKTLMSTQNTFNISSELEKHN
jgi:hypothetical protein